MKKYLGILGVLAGLALTSCTTDAATPVEPVTVTATSVSTSVVTTVAFIRTTEVTTETEFITETAVETKTIEKKVPTTVVKTAVKTVIDKAAEPTAPAHTASGKLDFENGDYLLGSGISAGTYECLSPNDDTAWLLYDASGGVAGGNFGGIAIVTSDVYTVKLTRCDALWAPPVKIRCWLPGSTS